MTSDENESGTEYAVDGISIGDLGEAFTALGEDLTRLGQHPDWKPDPAERYIRDLQGWDEHSHEVIIAEEKAADAQRYALTRALTTLGRFRRDYARWERLAVEYAIRHGVSQRRAATLLGVGLSTVNRWAQDPLSASADADE